MDDVLRRLEAEARRRVEAVSDDPEGRYALREAFYRRFGDVRREPYGFGVSELAFLRYEIERGVLAPLGAEKPGSAWWRQVNATLLYAAELARLVVEAGYAGAEVGQPTRAWLDYIAEPTGVSWYRAHNTSIVRGYLDAVAAARGESSDEQLFMNEVLYRLLFAEAMVTGAALGELGEWAADPRLPGVDILVHLPAFYPRSYPMTAAEAIDVHHQGHGIDEDLARLLDQELILPHLTRLYQLVARDLKLEELREFVRDGRPVYPPRPEPPPGPRQQVLILGAGASALAAAWELTRHEGWRERYDVTVQVLGWRVGGKTSTGRGAFDRIEEHGIHILQGWYDVTFDLLARVYDERRERRLDPRAPFQRWQDGFEPNNSTLLTEYIPGRGWVNWPLIFPPNEATPGQGPPLSTWQLIKKMVGMALEMLLGSPYSPDQGPLARWLLDHFFPSGGGVAARAARWLGGAAPGAAGRALGAVLVEAVEHLDDDLEGPVELILEVLERAVSWLENKVDEQDPEWDQLRRVLLVAELVLVNLRGIVADVWVPSASGRGGHFAWEQIDGQDYREWLGRHGAGRRVLDSVVVRFFYTGTFANLTGPWGAGGRLAAGTALRFVLSSAGYKGSFVYQFKAGTGDTMIMPLYEVLAARGVKFEFFREVKSVERPATPGGPVERVVVAEQVTLRGEVYDPTIRVQRLKAWPARPLYDQIDAREAEELRARDVDLESPWADWKPPVERTLERGRDYDQLILALPVATLRTVCASFYEGDARWRAMIDGVQTTATMSLQLWLRPDLAQLGFDRASWGLAAQHNAPNVVVYQSPLYSWLDSTLVRPWESWPADQTPGTITYFTGSMSDPARVPGFDDHGYPGRARAALAGLTGQWVRDNMAWFWPEGARREAPQGLDPSLLLGPTATASAAEREEFQYVRANVDPWQRYTLSVPGSARARLRADGSGYEGLWLAGDWIDFGMNVGYIEGALRSGLQAAEALRDKLGLDGEPSLQGPTALGPQGLGA